jgi:hypothetical protein
MVKHLVTATVEVEANNPREAVEMAVGLLRRNPPSSYTVKDESHYTFRIHLDEDALKAAIDRIWI